MPTARIHVDDNFRKLSAQYSRATEKALGRAAAVTVAVARSAPVEYQIQDVLSSIRVTPAHTTSKGKRIIVYAADFRAIFFEFGTYARRRRRIRGRRTPRAVAIAAQPGSGVKPQRFLTRAVKPGQAALLRYLRAFFP